MFQIGYSINPNVSLFGYYINLFFVCEMHRTIRYTDLPIGDIADHLGSIPHPFLSESSHAKQASHHCSI